MKKITEDQTKMELVSKLVKDGAIDFSEAIKLMEVEVEKEYVYVHDFIQQPFYVQPPYIFPPTNPLPWYQLGDGIGTIGGTHTINCNTANSAVSALVTDDTMGLPNAYTFDKSAPMHYTSCAN
jgi:hypothetical protein